jgi:hypothetical protein
LRIVFIADTHTLHDRVSVPAGDVLVHCGDFCGRGTLNELKRFSRWFAGQAHLDKIVVAGNHDWPMERQRALALSLVQRDFSITYLQDSSVIIGGLRFWGSPWQPEFRDWAFNLPRGPLLARKWALIPTDTDVLVTHTPPMGVLDVAGGAHLGCADLADRLAIVRPTVHAFGHIHEGSGVLERDGTTYVNAAICDGQYRPTNPVRVVDVPG